MAGPEPSGPVWPGANLQNLPRPPPRCGKTFASYPGGTLNPYGGFCTGVREMLYAPRFLAKRLCGPRGGRRSKWKNENKSGVTESIFVTNLQPPGCGMCKPDTHAGRSEGNHKEIKEIRTAKDGRQTQSATHLQENPELRSSAYTNYLSFAAWSESKRPLPRGILEGVGDIRFIPNVNGVKCGIAQRSSAWPKFTLLPS